ncbi:beta-xylosidase/alpha-l-arabinosidase [Auraticoccus monumenti]|uniref:Beta-glucosidase n=1 Tax=Auraticoccus monumenti TaxID=675864 RepID=A0A1G7ARU3_9ACTN|nr:glycoside hydrolase family 3 N-terminal domain-containing protein [Auraticoccus monumenti]SDE17511.1 beta-glucosidase [Auraticoccus monumenti]
MVDRGASEGTALWQDVSLPAEVRAEDLAARMTLPEKLAQLVGLWVGADASGGGVAPRQAEMAAPVVWEDAIQHGLGQLTRPYGTVPVEPTVAARSLAAAQQQVVAASRFGLPALVHEECLTGFAAWQATVYPAPLAWGAAFHPELVEEVARSIGASMRAAGVHQGLAPVLDVTRDPRWGRTEETIGEDPYLVATLGAAYVAGLEGTGLVATLKHFAGYAGSRAARNLAPVSIGPRELADVVLPPFETALRHGGARSVMHSYTELDGVPSAADEELLTGLLRDRWGFTGTVVADYFGVRFLETLHRVAAGPGEAAALALRAGVDVELPNGDAYTGPLQALVEAGKVPEALVDRALLRVLTQKAELGLLDPDWTPATPDPLVLDTEDSRELALRLARESVVLLRNDDALLPLRPGTRLALVGPLADDPMAVLGCYTFPVHVGRQHPGVALGLEIPTVRERLRTDGFAVDHAEGCSVDGPDDSGLDGAVAAARSADVCVVVVGDRSGLFGRGTSGEGCDAPDLRLPGLQHELVTRVLATGTPTVLLVVSGRPYALGGFEAAGAVVQTFFPGQRGAEAVVDVLTGRVCPSGRLPVSVPADPGAQPTTYLAAPLARRSDVSNLDPTPLFPFGHGLSFTSFDWSDVEAPATWPVDGDLPVGLTVTNTGDRAGADVVQLYLHDPVAQVTRPVERLVGYARVELEPGASARLTLTVPADLASFTGLAGRRVVEPGAVELRVARSSSDVHTRLAVEMVGPLRETGPGRQLLSRVEVGPTTAQALEPLDEEDVA